MGASINDFNYSIMCVAEERVGLFRVGLSSYCRWNQLKMLNIQFSLCIDSHGLVLFRLNDQLKMPTHNVCVCVCMCWVPVGNIDMTMINTTRCHVENDGTHLEADIETDQGTNTAQRSAQIRYTNEMEHKPYIARHGGGEVCRESSNRERERWRPVSWESKEGAMMDFVMCSLGAATSYQLPAEVPVTQLSFSIQRTLGRCGRKCSSCCIGKLVRESERERDSGSLSARSEWM